MHSAKLALVIVASVLVAIGIQACAVKTKLGKTEQSISVGQQSENE